MLKNCFVALLFGIVIGEEDITAERKSVGQLFESKQFGQRRLGKGWSTDSWDTGATTDDSCASQCSAYDSTTSSSGGWNRRLLGKSWSTDTSDCWNRRRLGKASSWSTDGNDPCTTTAAPFETYCDCLCACEGTDTVSYTKDVTSRRRRRNARRLGKASSWSTDTSDCWNRRRLGKASSWSTDGNDPCTTTEEPFETTTVTCQCDGTTNAPSDNPTDRPTNSPSTDPSKSPTDRPTSSPSKDPTQSPSDKPTQSPNKDPTQSPSDKPSESPSDKPSESPSDRPTSSPLDMVPPSRDPTDMPSDRPSSAPSDEPTREPSEQPTEQPSEEPTSMPSNMPTPTCEEGTDYFELTGIWEMYVSSVDGTLVMSGRYNQDGDEFIHESASGLAIWFEEIGTDHLFVVGNSSNSLFQIFYKDLVSTWTDDNNPLIDSDDESEWDPAAEGTEFITGNMTLYDCEGNDLGTDVYTQYSHIYFTNGGEKINFQFLALLSVLLITIAATLW